MIKFCIGTFKHIKIYLLTTISIIAIHVNCFDCFAKSCELDLCAYKNTLSCDELLVYNQACEAAANYNTDSIDMACPLSEDDLEIVMSAVYFDHPEYFWVNTNYNYGMDSKGICHVFQLTYGIPKSDLANAKVNYNNMVTNIVNEASTYSTEEEKERYIHDTLCNLATYKSGCALSQSSYSVLSSGETVCAGYARAFQHICNLAGIPCYYITGTSRGQNHAWNIVYVDGRFLNVDLTWNDSLYESTGTYSYTYFNQPDSVFNNDHCRSTLSAQLMACN